MLVRIIESSWASFNWARQAGGPEKFCFSLIFYLFFVLLFQIIRIIESRWATFNWAGQAGGPEKFYAGRRKGETRTLVGEYCLGSSFKEIQSENLMIKEANQIGNDERRKKKRGWGT